jgi:hypothetical protein
MKRRQVGHRATGCRRGRGERDAAGGIDELGEAEPGERVRGRGDLLDDGDVGEPELGGIEVLGVALYEMSAADAKQATFAL